MRLLFRTLVFTVGMVLISASAQSGYIEEQNGWAAPDYFKLQYAGNIGFLSGGFGYLLADDNFSADLIYGYVPQSLAGTDIHSLTVKANVMFYHVRLSSDFVFTPVYAGLTGSVALGDTYFLRVPDRYPRNYYWPTALRFGAFVGTKAFVEFKKVYGVRGIETFFEVGTVDIYLRNYLLSDQVDLWEIIHFSAGCSFYF